MHQDTELEDNTEKSEDEDEELRSLNLEGEIKLF